MIVILDFGSQYSEIIARRVRENQVYSEVLLYSTPIERIKKLKPKGIILSGGPISVYEENPPLCDPEVFDLGIPVLGICYGMQLMIQHFGGKVTRAKKGEYGKAPLYIENPGALLTGVSQGSTMWMSHSDCCSELPRRFYTMAYTLNTENAAVYNPTRRLFGVQFHPEVNHSEGGDRILSNFIFTICRCDASWTTESFIDTSIRDIKETVGDKKVLLALSGGVDSSTLAFLLHKAIGDNLTCMFIDQGFMRKGEPESLVQLFAEKFKIPVAYVKCRKRFLSKIKGITDPELKRKYIGHEFIKVFEEESQRLGPFDYLAQGTLYPDVIESSYGTAFRIKSHHNVGGLPDSLKFKLIEPFRKLFKDEVRNIGSAIGLPEEIVHRHPFPGPGLAIRVIGEVTDERLKILRKADFIVREEITERGLYRKFWQVFAVLLPTVYSVGVMGDNRTYAHPIVLRFITSEDGMTADWAKVPYDLLETISNRIVNEIEGINRVVYDITSKPPATIEWE